jgi:hypothetical protein
LLKDSDREFSFLVNVIAMDSAFRKTIVKNL